MSGRESTRGNSTHYDCILIDDDELLSRATCEFFKIYGINMFWAENAQEALAFFNDHTVDLILLDINLDGDTGFELCRSLREITDVPIFFLSVRQSDDDKLLAFSIGGDEYIQKPCSLSVLHATVKATLTRYRNTEAMSSTTPILRKGDLILDENEFALKYGNHKTVLRPMEFKLLRYLMQNNGRVITKDEIFRKVWQEAITSENTLNVHIRRLREKLESDVDNPRFIKTIWGVGYVFDAEGPVREELPATG